MTIEHWSGWSSSKPQGYRRSQNPRVVFADWDKVEREHPKLYLAYGSNLDVIQMQSRCTTSFPEQPINLLGHRLAFSGVATVEPCEGEVVPAALYRVKTVDIFCLDAYEGYPSLYDKIYGVIEDGDLKGERFFFYRLNDPYELSPPNKSYYNTLMQGYMDWELPKRVLRKARKAAIRADKKAEKKWRTNIKNGSEDRVQVTKVADLVPYGDDLINDIELDDRWISYEICELCQMETPVDEIDVVWDDDFAYAVCESCRGLLLDEGLDMSEVRYPEPEPVEPYDMLDRGHYWTWDPDEGDFVLTRTRDLYAS